MRASHLPLLCTSDTHGSTSQRSARSPINTSIRYTIQASVGCGQRHGDDEDRWHPLAITTLMSVPGGDEGGEAEMTDVQVSQHGEVATACNTVKLELYGNTVKLQLYATR